MGGGQEHFWPDMEYSTKFGSIGTSNGSAGAEQNGIYTEMKEFPILIAYMTLPL